MILNKYGWFGLILLGNISKGLFFNSYSYGIFKRGWFFVYGVYLIIMFDKFYFS